MPKTLVFGASQHSTGDAEVAALHTLSEHDAPMLVGGVCARADGKLCSVHPFIRFHAKEDRSRRAEVSDNVSWGQEGANATHTSSLYLMIVLFSLDWSTHVTKSSVCLWRDNEHAEQRRRKRQCTLTA